MQIRRLRPQFQHVAEHGDAPPARRRGTLPSTSSAAAIETGIGVVAFVDQRDRASVARRDASRTPRPAGGAKSASAAAAASRSPPSARVASSDGERIHRDMAARHAQSVAHAPPENVGFDDATPSASPRTRRAAPPRLRCAPKPRTKRTGPASARSRRRSNCASSRLRIADAARARRRRKSRPSHRRWLRSIRDVRDGPARCA